jgi:hypothetical protein
MPAVDQRSGAAYVFELEDPGAPDPPDPPDRAIDPPPVPQEPDRDEPSDDSGLSDWKREEKKPESGYLDEFLLKSQPLGFDSLQPDSLEPTVKEGEPPYRSDPFVLDVNEMRVCDVLDRDGFLRRGPEELFTGLCGYAEEVAKGKVLAFNFEERELFKRLFPEEAKTRIEDTAQEVVYK